MVNEINVPPVLSPLVSTNINELTTLTLTNAATDSDIPANPLTYALLNAPAGAMIDTNGVITWTPTEGQGPSTNTFTTVVYLGREHPEFHRDQYLFGCGQ